MTLDISFDLLYSLSRQDWVPVLLIGLLGSAHCIGMCGGFVVALSHASSNRRFWQFRQLFYYTGKTATYALLGAVAGGLGHVIGGLFSGMQQALSIVLGLFLIGIGLGLAGLFRRISGPGWLALWKPFTRMAGGLLKQDSYPAALGLGLLNGLLPCGLVYGALAVAAASGDVVSGALIMTVFGLSTIPSLLATAGVMKLLQPVWRSRLNIVSAVIIVILGVITIFRGFRVGHGL